MHQYDYYSGYEGSNEIRFYSNPATTKFRLNEKRIPNGWASIQLLQGENGITHFSMWEGFIGEAFDYFIDEAFKTNSYPELPKFLQNYNECKGYCDLDSRPELIPSDDILKFNLLLDHYLKNENPTISGTKECLSDLILFLKYVIREENELRIAEE